jgi:hypothetical protein
MNTGAVMGAAILRIAVCLARLTDSTSTCVVEETHTPESGMSQVPRSEWLSVALPPDHDGYWWRANFCSAFHTFEGGPLDGCRAEGRGSPRFYLVAFRRAGVALDAGYLWCEVDQHTEGNQPVARATPRRARLLGWYEWVPGESFYRWREAEHSKTKSPRTQNALLRLRPPRPDS